MNNSRRNSPEGGEIPIPRAHNGPLRNVDRIKRVVQHSVYSVKQNISTRTIACIIAISILAVPTLLTSPAFAHAISTEPRGVTTPVLIPDHWDTTLTTILNNEVSRLDIETTLWPQIIDQYIAMVREIESDNKRLAYNPSGAMSYFQFKDTSIQTAHNRLLNYLKRYDLGRAPRWSVALYYNPEHIYHTSSDRQALLMMINIIEQDRERGTNYIEQLLGGDTRAGVEAYYRYHHTRPDSFTIKRTERLYKQYFGSDQELVARTP